MFKTVVIACAALFSLSAMAEWNKIIDITNSVNKTIGQVWVDLDENKDITLFKYALKGDENKVDVFTVDDLIRGEVFKDGFAKKYVKLQSENFSAHQGGLIKVTMPKNVATGAKKYASYSLERLGDEWELNQGKTFAIKKLHIIMKRFLGIPVGVKEIKAPVYGRRL